jgi:ESS family glutamate:Na+ symporter
MPETLSQLSVEPVEVLVLSILVLYLGMFLNDKIRFLGDNYIPPAVTGGLICSGIVAVIYFAAHVQINFDMRIRDVLLLVFFSTVGLSAKLRTLGAGGKALGLLVIVAAVFLVIQDATGIGLAMLLGAHPGYGLMAGSVSFAGGHGTAIAWGAQADAAGLKGGSEIGIAFATFGLVAGGLIGGPIAKRLVSKYRLQGPALDTDSTPNNQRAASSEDHGSAGELKQILAGTLVLALCVQFGHAVNRYLFSEGVVLPGFLTSMLVGIVVTNTADLLNWRINKVTVDKFGEVALNLFLSMSLMSMQLWTVAGAFGKITFVLIIQMLVMTLFAIYIVFWVMGRDYDAAVIASGFAGLGLGATPVAIANMSSVTSRFGPSPKAYLVVPLVGAFFIDLLNAATIKFFIGVIKKWLI